jgi:hypothetical protein
MNRTLDQYDMTFQKRVARLWAFVTIPTGTTPVLMKYNYPQMGQTGSPARTLTAAPTTGGGNTFPTRYAQGAEGVFSVARTGAGLWTLTLQDAWQRLLGVRGDHSIAGGTANIIQVVENPTITVMNTAVGGGFCSVIGIGLLSATATLADPTASATSLIRIQLDLCDATEP